MFVREVRHRPVNRGDLRQVHRKLYRSSIPGAADDGRAKEILDVSNLKSSSDLQTSWSQVNRNGRQILPVVHDDVSSARFIFVRPNDHVVFSRKSFLLAVTIKTGELLPFVECFGSVRYFEWRRSGRAVDIVIPGIWSRPFREPRS